MLLPISAKCFMQFCRFPPNLFCLFRRFPPNVLRLPRVWSAIRDCRIATTIFTICQSELIKIFCELLHRFAIALPFGVPVRVIGICCAECAYLPKINGGKMFKSLREFTQFSLRFYSNLLRILLKSRHGCAMIGGCIVRPKCRRISAEWQPKERYIRAASVRLPLVFGSRWIG